LNPISVQEILRVRGRLNKSYIAFEVAHPIILPEDCHLTKLIISDCHEKLAGDLGVGSTLNQVYQRFWILNARVAVRRIVSKCVICNRINARLGEQIMVVLPKARLEIHELESTILALL